MLCHEKRTSSSRKSFQCASKLILGIEFSWNCRKRIKLSNTKEKGRDGLKPQGLRPCDESSDKNPPFAQVFCNSRSGSIRRRFCFFGIYGTHVVDFHMADLSHEALLRIRGLCKSEKQKASYLSGCGMEDQFNRP